MPLCVDSQKIKGKIIKHRAQISKKREAYSSLRSIRNASQTSIQFEMRGLLKPTFNSKCGAYSSQRSIKNVRLSLSQRSIQNAGLSQARVSIQT